MVAGGHSPTDLYKKKPYNKALTTGTTCKRRGKAIWLG